MSMGQPRHRARQGTHSRGRTACIPGGRCAGICTGGLAAHCCCSRCPCSSGRLSAARRTVAAFSTALARRAPRPGATGFGRPNRPARSSAPLMTRRGSGPCPRCRHCRPCHWLPAGRRCKGRRARVRSRRACPWRQVQTGPRRYRRCRTRSIRSRPGRMRSPPNRNVGSRRHVPARCWLSAAPPVARLRRLSSVRRLRRWAHWCAMLRRGRPIAWRRWVSRRCRSRHLRRAG